MSLIIAMVMLAIIGLASAAIMRNATSSDQVATNNRLQTQAHQFAQLALRYCEMQLTLAPGARSVTVYAVPSPAAWSLRGDWTGGGPNPAHTLAGADFSGALPPRVAPQCMVEASALPGVFTVTARGFSPDFTAVASTGATRTGSVVWLQSTLLTGAGSGAAAAQASAASAASSGDAAGATLVAAAAQVAPVTTGCADASCALTIRQRLWQQLLTPPF